MDKPKFGGQAVVEGVMFQSQNSMVTAIRRNNDEIEYFEISLTKNELFLIRFLRQQLISPLQVPMKNLVKQS